MPKKFTAKGFIQGKSVNVENVRYWISGHDLMKIAQASGVKTEGLRCDQYGIDGTEICVTIHKDHTGCWAEIATHAN